MSDNKKESTDVRPIKNLIGVFDSGLGGLTVLREFLRILPDYNYLYLGDTAHLPYGEKSPETIYNYSRAALDFLFSAGCPLVIFACNTASSQALRRLQQEYLPATYPQRRVLGVIRPLAENIASQKNLHTVGVIGTKATINSEVYHRELLKLRPDLSVIELATPLLVTLIEEGWADKPETKMILKKYLRPLKIKNIQALILGCTHYSFLYPAITHIVDRHVTVPAPGPIIAASLKEYLARHPELDLHPTTTPTCRYGVTDNPEHFRRLGEKFLGQRIVDLETVTLTNL